MAFLVAVTVPVRGNLRMEGVLACVFREQSFMAGKAWWQEYGAAGDIESMGRKQKEKNAGVQLTFSFLFSQGAWPWA